jgi:uncharacterized repeat protein (TIGR04138 family)
MFKVRKHWGRRDCVVKSGKTHYHEVSWWGMCGVADLAARGVCAVSELAWPDWKRVREMSGGFPPEAFQFVREGLAHTVRMIHGDVAMTTTPPPGDESRHVNGQQLCLGLKDFAVKQYGLLARTVLGRWGIHKTDDFGRIVFAMIDAGIMRKTADDTMADFCGVFEFDEAFGAGLTVR